MKKKYWVLIIFISLVIVGSGGLYLWKKQLLHNASTTVVAKPAKAVNISPKAKSANPVDVAQAGLANRINILLLGADNVAGASHTDSMILISADTQTHHVSIISIPRDTRVNLPGVGLTKITHANAVGEAVGGVHEGTMMAVQAASNLLGVTINDYIKINFIGFKKVVDTLGGVEVNLATPVNDRVRNLHLPVGEQKLNGVQALKLARVRYSLPDGDFGRQRNQFDLLMDMAHQMLSLKEITKLPQVISVIHQDLIDTNLSDAQMVALGTDFRGISSDKIKYFQLPGHGITAHDPLVGADVYYYEINSAGVKKVVEEALSY